MVCPTGALAHLSQVLKTVIWEHGFLRTSRASDLARSMSRSKASRRGRVPSRSIIMESGATVHAHTGKVVRRRLARELPRRGPPLRDPADKDIHLVTLWTRACSKFDVEFDVDPDTEQEQMIAGRVSCKWNVGLGHRSLCSRKHADSCPSGLLSRRLRMGWSRPRTDFLFEKLRRTGSTDQ